MSKGKKILLVVLILAIPLIALGVKLIYTPVRVASEVVDEVATGRNLIYNYEWFHSKYESIQAKIQNCTVAKMAYAEWYGSVASMTWTYVERDENARLIGIINGLRMIINEMIADYNAKSKMVTRQIFRGKSLPEQIPNFTE